MEADLNSPMFHILKHSLSLSGCFGCILRVHFNVLNELFVCVGYDDRFGVPRV
jgi:hypothetical protein